MTNARKKVFPWYDEKKGLLLDQVSDGKDPKPYDNTFKELIEKETRLLIPLVNELFGTAYPDDAKVELLHEEHHRRAQNGTLRDVITDAYFSINGHYYHIEVQSNPDETIIVRMLEYDFAIAFEQMIVKNGRRVMRLPHSSILYLRQRDNTPDFETIDIESPDGDTIFSYNVQIVKTQNYTKDELFGKRLFILLPFYLFRYTDVFNKLENDIDARSKFVNDIKDLIDRLLALKDEGNEYEIAEIFQSIAYVGDYLLAGRQSLRMEVSNIMGGKALNFSPSIIHRDGAIQGAIESYADVKMDPEEIKTRIMNRFDMDEEEADEAIRKYYNSSPAMMG